jgi:hypothetical protein
MAKVIEFHIPATFRKTTRWILRHMWESDRVPPATTEISMNPLRRAGEVCARPDACEVCVGLAWAARSGRSLVENLSVTKRRKDSFGTNCL